MATSGRKGVAVRRHLTPSQKSMVAARAREYYDKAAKERQKMGKENLPYPEQSGQARDAAGKAVGVSGNDKRQRGISPSSIER